MRTKRKLFAWNEAKKSFHALLIEQPLLPFVIPLLLLLWAVEKWFFSLSNWVLLVLAVWIAFQYGSNQRRNIVEDLNRRWMQVTLQTSPETPLEQCNWLNKLLTEVWSNFINPKLSLRFSSIVERRLKHRKPRLIDKIELQEFSLGPRPPMFGLYGTRWVTSSDQQILRTSFDWDTNDVSIMLFAKLAKPLMGTARIVVNSIHIKGDLILIPILEGKAIVFSFISAPEVRLGVAFGSGGSQSLPATELPGVSSWLVKLVIDTLNKRMVEPRRQCLALPAEDFRKKAVGGVLNVTVVSASKLSGKQPNSSVDPNEEDFIDSKELQTFLEIELDELTRRTDVRAGSSPQWDTTFNLILHDSSGILKFNLYQCTPGSIKYDYLTSCEIKMRYVQDDSTIFWAIGVNSSVIAKHAESCGKEIELTVPFESANSGELTVRLVLKEWHFADGSHSSPGSSASSRHSLSGSSSYSSTTGRRLFITVLEGKDLLTKDKTMKSDHYVKLHYGKAVQRTKTVPHSSNPTWNQKFEFDEVAGEYLQIKCFNEETFGDEFIGSARVNLEGLSEGCVRDVCIPLEKVSSGELRLQIEATKVDKGNSKGSQASLTNGWIELVLIEARDLVAADFLHGTSDPFVRVHYGNLKRTTKVMDKTLHPKWDQTFEFPDDGSPLTLHVKDHNILLRTSSIGDCIVEYQMLQPNQTADKWIPLQGVKRGEIHVRVTRKFPELERKANLVSEANLTEVRQHISSQMGEMMIKIRSQADDSDIEGILESLSELESLHNTQQELVTQLETEQGLLLDKINELGQEIFNSSPSFTRTTTIG